MRNLILSVLFVGILNSFAAFAESILPDDLHSMPVLIEIPLNNGKSSYGTGLYLCQSNQLFLVTAAHCLFNFDSTNFSELINSNAILSSFVMGKDSSKKGKLYLDLNRLSESSLVKRHRAHDIAVIKLAKIYSEQEGAPADSPASVYYSGGVVSRIEAKKRFAVFFNVISFNEIYDGNETYILGYPVELFNERIPLEIDFNSPLIRKGIISQKNRITQKLIIDSGVFGGNSGGPVLVCNHELDKIPNVTSYRVAGLITQFVPYLTRIPTQIGVTNSAFVNSGYSIVEPIDYALELMQQF